MSGTLLPLDLPIKTLPGSIGTAGQTGEMRPGPRIAFRGRQPCGRRGRKGLPLSPPDPLADRRRQRLELPPCPECSSDDVRVMTRTDYVVYIRCEQCLHLWSVPKPGVPPMPA